MFAKFKVTQSMIDAVNQVIGENKEEVKKPELLDENKKRMITDAEMDETGFHKAAHAAKRANQSHFEFQGKKYPVTAKSHKEAIEVDEAAEKVPTPTGMKVYGSSYGNSAKARRDQTKSAVDTLKGPKAKELVEDGDCVTPPQAKDIAKKEVGKHEKGMHGKKGEVAKHVKKMHKESFADRLLAKAHQIQEDEKRGDKEPFTDNNIGEEEMSAVQKAKREKIVLSMKKGETGFKHRYGKNWKNVMYATATKQAMKEGSSDVWEGQLFNEEVVDLPIDPLTGEMKDDYEILVSGDNIKLKNKEIMMIEEGVTTSTKKNQDIADKAYLKHKPGTVKGTMTQLGRFLRGKPEIKESVATEREKSGETSKITTDMLSGRVRGGKLNSFKNFKVDLVTSGEEAIAKEVDKGEDTREKQKITTNPGPVNIKFDDKLGHPTVQSHFSSEHQITHEEVKPVLKGIHSKEAKMRAAELKDFSKHPGHLLPTKEEIQIDEKTIAGTPGWEKMAKNVKDKSGAVHTPMSRARDLARKSFKKLKKETMMGKIAGGV